MANRVVAIYRLQLHHSHEWNTVLRPGSNKDKKDGLPQNLKCKCKRSDKYTDGEGILETGDLSSYPLPSLESRR